MCIPVLCVYECVSVLLDAEPSAGPAAVLQSVTSSASSGPATKSQTQQKAADIQRQLEVGNGLTAFFCGVETTEILVQLTLAYTQLTFH